MPTPDEIIDFLEEHEALRPGESPWPTFQPGDHDLYQVAFPTLLPVRGQATDTQWFPPQEFVGELAEVAGTGLPENPEEDEVGDWDRCGWYQPIHFFAHDWGIFIREECVRQAALRIARCLGRPHLGLAAPAALVPCVTAAFSVYFLHAQFHHKIESLGLRLHVVERTSRYLPYMIHVYRPTLRSDDNLEEALANADAYRRLSTPPYSEQIERPILKATRTYLSWRFRHDPLSYRRASEYLTNEEFTAGLDRLYGQLQEGTARPVRPSGQWSLAPRLNQSFFSVASDIWLIVRRGARPVVPASSDWWTLGTSDVHRYLRSHGYHLEDGGKGSHMVYKRAGAPMITLPANRRDLSPIVLRNTAKALGLRNAYALFKAVQAS